MSAKVTKLYKTEWGKITSDEKIFWQQTAYFNFFFTASGEKLTTVDIMIQRKKGGYLTDEIIDDFILLRAEAIKLERSSKEKTEEP